MRFQHMSKKEFREAVERNILGLYRKHLDEATDQEKYQAVAQVVKEEVIDRWIATRDAIEKTDPKTVYYMSMEFLVGRALGNNLLNIGSYDRIREYLDDMGIDINAIEDQEPDPALGNGGLGRLAACFMDSLSTLGYPAYGCGIRYRYGMFKQKIEDGYQKEVPDDWLKENYPFELKRSEYKYEVKFGGYVSAERQPDGRMKFVQKDYKSVFAVPYDMPIVGFENNMVNTLIMWDAEAKEEFSLSSFDRGAYEKAVEEQNLAQNLVEVLYPNDNHVFGKELRLRQQYFFVSASIQRALGRFKHYHDDLHLLPEKVVFQMNDTHPTLAVAELMRILVDEEGLDWDDAWEITRKTCAYTNHTIMQEALEKWPIEIFSRLLPRIYQIVEEINRRFCEEVRQRFPGDEDRVRRMAIVQDGQVRMAYLAIVGGFSVNGVAAIHTEYPEKFSNKTNGITQRRFLLHGDRELADWVTKYCGKGWVTDLSKTKELEIYADDKKAQHEFLAIKRHNKERLARYIKEHNGIDVDPDSIFDVQVKRLHEYKRQLLNIIDIMYLYNELKDNPEQPFTKRTFIFGAKASAGYHVAKLIIKLINNVANVINNDPAIDGKIKVVFIEDYRVSNAEWIFAAADISEQISTASKEASGTSNMKFMLNGAITLGTMDGANVEIVEEVGQENAFIFGMSADEVIAHEIKRDYNPMDIFNNDQDIRRVLTQMINGYYSPEDPELFRDIYNSLLNTQVTQYADTYFVLKDFRSYDEARKKAAKAYEDREHWAEMAIRNIAHVGKFSSDRTIQEYVDDIWHLDRVRVEKWI